MSEGTQFNIVSAARGLCLTHSSAGNPSGVVAHHWDKDNVEQRWVIEYGDDENTVALKNLANNLYLNAKGNRAGAQVGTGEKQWWKISRENVTGPALVRLTPVPHPNVVLNHFQGLNTPRVGNGMRVHMWPWDPNWEWCMLWYFVDPSVDPAPAILGSGANEGGKTKAEADAKVKELEEREEALKQSQKEFEGEKALVAQRKNDLDAQSADIDSKQQSIHDKEIALAQKDKDQAASNEKKLKELQDKEAELAKKAKEQAENTSSGKAAAEDFEKQLKDLQAREQALAQKEKEEASEREAELNDVHKRTTELDHREKDLKTREESAAAQLRKSEDEQTKQKDKTSQLNHRKKGLDRREARLKELEEKKPAASNVNAQASGKTTNEQQAELDKRVKGLRKRESDVVEKEKLLDEREKQMKQARSAERPSVNDSKAVPNKRTSASAANDDQVKQLQDRMAKLEAQLAERQATQNDTSFNGRPTSKQPNGGPTLTAKPSSGRPSASKPAASKPATTKPAPAKTPTTTPHQRHLPGNPRKIECRCGVSPMQPGRKPTGIVYAS